MTDKEKKELLADMFEVETYAIKPATALDSLIWDSIKRITFIALVNDHFESMIDSTELKQASTISDLLEMMEPRAD